MEIVRVPLPRGPPLAPDAQTDGTGLGGRGGRALVAARGHNRSALLHSCRVASQRNRVEAPPEESRL
jgi:hypothetical protein